MKREIIATKSVYAYYLPEVRACIDEVVKDYPHDVFLKSISPGLDDYHLELIDKYLAYQPGLKGLEKYEYRYYSNGSSESIFQYLVWIKNNYPKEPVYVFEGEYEGYGAYGSNLGMKITNVAFDKEAIGKLKRGFWFISNPSARDGNLLSNGMIKYICDLGHKVIYDLSYVGTTKPHEFDLSHPNILAALISFSKPMGLFYYRVGMTFSRVKMLTLHPNIWFKNVLSLMIVDRVLSRHKAGEFYNKYCPRQLEILKQIESETGIRMRPSDIYLLGYMTADDYEQLSDNQKQMVEGFRRGKVFRFSLTPYYLEAE